MNAMPTVQRSALKLDSHSSDAPAYRRAANDGPTTHQLQFAYLPVSPLAPSASATEVLLGRWLQDRSDSLAAAAPMPNFGESAGALSKADRFWLGHAASALKNLQSLGIAGRAVIHLSTSCLTDPMLPVYVISLFQRRGVSLLSVKVSADTGRQRRPKGTALQHTASEFPTYVRHHTDRYPTRPSSWVDALLGRFGLM